MSTTRIPTAALALAALAASGCSSTANYRTPHDTAHEDGAIEALSAELVDAASLRATLSTMRVSVRALPGKDSVETYGPVATARGMELTSLGIALKDELVSALSRRMYVLAPEPPVGAAPETGARATHEVVGHFIRLEDELLVSLRLVDADSSVIVASARGAVPLAPLVNQGALMWSTPASEPAAPARPREAARGGATAPGPAGPTPVHTATSPEPAPADDLVARDAAEEIESTPEASEPAGVPDLEDPGLEAPSEEVAEAVPGPAAIRRARLLEESRD